MKRKLTLALAVIMAAGALTGCGGSTPSENSTNSVADESAPAGTTAPIESQTESQTEPATDTSATEPAQETVSEPEIQPLPEKIEFEGFAYKTAGFDNIDPEAPLGETICTEEAKDLVIPEFPFKATPTNIETWGKTGKAIFLPESASDNNDMCQITTLTIRPDHTADYFNIPYASYKNTDTGSYYNSCIEYKSITSDVRGVFRATGNNTTSEYSLVSDKYAAKGISAHDVAINELPLLLSNGIDVDSHSYVTFKDSYFYSRNGKESMRYNISTEDPSVSKAYFYICGIGNGIDNSVVYSVGGGNFQCMAVYLYNDGTLTMTQILSGLSIYNDVSNTHVTVPSEEVATLDDLRSSDPGFDTAYTAWLDGKMPFMIPLDEYLEKYAADSANG